MPDHVAKNVRSAIMASVGTRNTGPKLTLRRAAHRLGFRYRTNVRDLPGSPDLVFPKLRKVIFVHGCYWHGHECRWGKLPKSRVDYWSAKIVGNRERDARAVTGLKRQGWKVLIAWQCQIRDLGSSMPRILKFLRAPLRKKSA